MNCSHDYASRELLKASDRIIGDIYTHMELVSNPPDLEQYDAILCYVWEDTGTIELLTEHAQKTILVLGAGHYMQPEELDRFKRLPEAFNLLGHVNMDLYRFYSSHFPTKTHIYLTHGVDTDTFRPAKHKPGKKLVIGWVGDMASPIKHYERAERIQQLVKNSILKPAHDLPREKMPEYYNSLDCLIVTSDFEAHPLVVYEAMSCGVPVICPALGDVSDTIINHVNGYLVNTEIPDNYVSIINHLRTNPNEANYIRHSARLTILQRWPWSRIKEQYEAFAPEPVEDTITLPPDTEVAITGGITPNPGTTARPALIRSDYRIKAITWGGAFFLGLVESGLKERCNFEIIDKNAVSMGPDFDILYVVSPRIMKQRLYRSVVDKKKHIIFHWIGSDILGLRDEYEANNNTLPEIFTRYPNRQHHFGVSQNLVDELKEMGIAGMELNLVSNWSLPIHPLPDEFTVLVYYPPVGSGKYANLYGQDVIKRIIEQRPDIKFIMYGLRPNQVPDFRADNVTFEWWKDTEEEMRELYNRGSVLLRYNMHDGYPSSTIEMCMRGGHVITNGKFPYTIHVQNEQEILDALDDIRDYKILNVRGSRYYNQNQTKDVFLNKFMTYISGIRVGKY